MRAPPSPLHEYTTTRTALPPLLLCKFMHLLISTILHTALIPVCSLPTAHADLLVALHAMSIRLLPLTKNVSWADPAIVTDFRRAVDRIPSFRLFHLAIPLIPLFRSQDRIRDGEVYWLGAADRVPVEVLAIVVYEVSPSKAGVAVFVGAWKCYDLSRRHILDAYRALDANSIGQCHNTSSRSSGLLRLLWRLCLPALWLLTLRCWARGAFPHKCQARGLSSSARFCGASRSC